MITTQDTDPLAQTQQRLDAVLLRLQHIEEAAELLGLPDDDTTDSLLIGHEQWRPLKEALDAG